MASMFSGFGGREEISSRTKASFVGSWSIGLKRRSKPMVELGRPHMPRPHEPSKWAGNTST